MMDIFLKVMMWITGAILLGILIYIPVACNTDNRLWKQCLDDGHKEYECRGILRGNRR